MKNRVLSVILTIFMLVSMMSVFAVPTSAATIAFTRNPAVLIGGEGKYNIVFQTNNAGIAYVTYTVNGVNYTVYDEENGVVRSDDTMHTIRVPQEHLDAAGSYTIVAKTVSSRDGFSISTSDQVTKSFTFNGYKGQKTVTFGFTSDTHWHPTKSNTAYMTNFRTLVNTTLGRPDVMVLNGDIVDGLSDVASFNALFDIITAAGNDGTYPVLYVVGNHEKRGPYSKEIEKYLSFSNGELYTYFEFGPLSTFVSDVGEDKNDSNISYTASDDDKIGVVDMERYFAQQLNFFKKYASFNKDATYTFTIGHGPGYVGNDTNPVNETDFYDFFEKIGADVHFYGHNHQLQFVENRESTTIPSVGVCSTGNYSGVNSFRGVKVTFGTDADGYDMYNMTAYGTNGATAWTASVDADENGKPQTYVEPETVAVEGKDEDFKAPNANQTSDTVKITTAPVVFDVGDYYNVVWQTDVESAGYVYVDGTEKYYMDYHGGILRTETMHSVRIPKADLAGKAFIVMNRVVTNYSSAGHYPINGSNWLTFGTYATGPAVKLNAAPTAGAKYTVLAVANKTAEVAEAEAVLAKYTKTPDLVVLAGDMIAKIETEADFAKLLTYTNKLTAGKVPVLFLRGEGEVKGAYAAELTRVLNTFGSVETANKFYGANVIGDVNVIGLDTAAKNADASYTYAAFDTIRAEQADWLKNDLEVSTAAYNVAFANAANLANVAGTDLASGLAKQGVDLAVVAGTTTSFVNDGDFAVATIGNADALEITFENNEISVAEISDAETPVTGKVAATPNEGGSGDEGDEEEPPVTGPTVATVGTKEYATLDAAMAAAKDGDTVTLVADAQINALYVSTGVTVDLNGKKLTTNFVAAFKGSNIVDNSTPITTTVPGINDSKAGIKTGGIYVGKDNVVMDKANAQLPVYDKEAGCYAFIKNTMRDDYIYYNYDSGVYVVTPIIGDNNAMRRGMVKKILGANDISETGFSLVVRVSWESEADGYSATQDFVYTDAKVINYINGYGKSGNNYSSALSAAFKGDALKQADTVYVSTVLVSETGVEIQSAITELDTTQLNTGDAQ